MLIELSEVLTANHMDPQRPLSADSYQSWHNTLQHQQDEVTRSKLPGGGDALTLRTVPASPVNVGQIAEAVFIVRAKDWQPSELRLNVHSETGNRIYELTEDHSEVLNLAQVDPNIFANETVSSAPAPKPSPQMSPASSPAANDWFLNSRGLKKAALRQNDFGGVFGGPVLLPRFGEGGRQPWYNGRNKTFFFVSYEGSHAQANCCGGDSSHLEFIPATQRS